jgi:hypothetical protein
MELTPTMFPSSAVHSIGWEAIKSGLRGNIHIQFHKDGELTQRGYFKEVQRAIFLGLEAAHKPGAFIHQNLREHFEWVRTDIEDLGDFDVSNLPDVIYYPIEGLKHGDSVEVFTACLDAQRIKPERTNLFE